MCETVDSTMLVHVFQCSKAKKMCDKAVAKDSKMLKLVLA